MRDFRAQDAEQVALLWQKCFRRSNRPPSEALKQYFVDVMLKHPWYDPQLGPIVLEQQGEVVGFIGRMARPMTFQGRTVRAAVATQLMVDPDRKLGFAALGLVRAAQNGPHDLIFSDGANEHSYRIWTRCGGHASRLMSFEWTRRLRPRQAFCCGMEERLGGLGQVVRPLAGVVDSVMVNLFPRLHHKPRLRRQRKPAVAGHLMPLLQKAAAAASLRPDYSETTLHWLLEEAGKSKRYGPLRTMMVLDEQGAAMGWFVYYVKPGRMAHVLQIGAIPMAGQAVVDELIRDAWEQGAAAVSGQLDPLLLNELSQAHCSFRCADYGVLVHTRHSDLLHAFLSGDTSVCRLDGEWWMRLGIDRYEDW